MKYVIEYQVRTAGLTHDQNPTNQDALKNAFVTWTPDKGLAVHAFLSNMNFGGYVLVEADDPNLVYSFVSKFYYWNGIQVVPVVDIEDGVAIRTKSLGWVRSALRG